MISLCYYTSMSCCRWVIRGPPKYKLILLLITTWNVCSFLLQHTLLDKSKKNILCILYKIYIKTILYKLYWWTETFYTMQLGHDYFAYTLKKDSTDFFPQLTRPSKSEKEWFVIKDLDILCIHFYSFFKSVIIYGMVICFIHLVSCFYTTLIVTYIINQIGIIF